MKTNATSGSRPYVSALWQGVPENLVDIAHSLIEETHLQQAGTGINNSEKQSQRQTSVALTHDASLFTGYNFISGRGEQVVRQALRAIITSGASICLDTTGKPPLVFFRADDIGVPSRLFSAMLDAHRRSGVPLALAVVPAWLTRKRAETLLHATDDAGLWLLHQHGWRHVNHETVGKKYEFGTSRPYQDKFRDLQKGADRLSALLGERFTRVFTPPWNRVDAQTLVALSQLGYSAISRTEGAKPETVSTLADIPVNVDLHTRREITPAESWTALLGELQRALASGRAGVMLHHQRMNANAVHSLQILCEELAESPSTALVDLNNAVL